MSATATLVQCADQPFESRAEAAPHRAAMVAEYGGHWSTVPCPMGDHFHVHRENRSRRAVEHNRRSRRRAYAD